MSKLISHCAHNWAFIIYSIWADGIRPRKFLFVTVSKIENSNHARLSSFCCRNKPSFSKWETYDNKLLYVYPIPMKAYSVLCHISHIVTYSTYSFVPLALFMVRRTYFFLPSISIFSLALVLKIRVEIHDTAAIILFSAAGEEGLLLFHVNWAILGSFL